MSLSHHHQNQLHLTQGRPPPVRPQLAARLSMFGRLSAGQAMPAREQVSSRHDRIRQAAALIAETISVVAAAIFLFLRASSSSGRSSPWPPPSRRAAAPGRPRKGANGHGPGRGAGGRPDPAAGADRRYQGESYVGAAPDQVVDQCPFEPVVDLVFGRWTSHMLWTLATKGRLRFSELHAQAACGHPKSAHRASAQARARWFLRRSSRTPWPLPGPRTPPALPWAVTR